jgi:probable rRNA maturation factor
LADPDSRLRVSVVDALGRPVRARALASWLVRVAPRRARGEVTIALVPDSRVQALNRQYREKDAVTDVLSFLGGEWGPTPTSPAPMRGRPRRSSGAKAGRSRSAARPGGRPEARSLTPHAYLGDIVIASGQAARQARAERHPLQTELRILALHGLLHLLGYDHERDQGQMRRLEARLRRRGGLNAGLIERT